MPSRSSTSSPAAPGVVRMTTASAVGVSGAETVTFVPSGGICPLHLGRRTTTDADRPEPGPGAVRTSVKTMARPEGSGGAIAVDAAAAAGGARRARLTTRPKPALALRERTSSPART